MRACCNPIILSEQPNEGRTVIEKFEHNAESGGFAIVLTTGDDVGGKTETDLQKRARQNVILELGYFVGAIGRRRVCALGSAYNCWTHRKLRKALEEMEVFKIPIPETTVVSPGVYNWRMKCGAVVNTESREITITPPHVPFIEYNRYTQFKTSYKWYNYFDGICDCELVRTSIRPGYDKD